MKKIVLLLLAFCMVLPLMACSNSKKPAEGGTKAPNTTTPDVSGDPYLDSLPDKDYDLYDFKILCTTQTAPFYALEEDDTDPISESVRRRNLAVEEKYNIILNHHPIDGNSTGKEEFNTTLRNSTMAGSDGFDLVIGQQYYCLPVATEGKLYDLSKSDYLHWDEKWYSPKINNNASVNGKIYGASGSYIMSQISYAMATFYSKELWVAQNRDEDLYQLVRDKQWTYEKLYEFSANIYEDADLDGMKSEGDKFGYVYNGHGIAASVAGSDVPIATRNEDGSMTILNYYNDHLLDVFNKYVTFYNDSLGTFKVVRDFGPAEMLASGKSLFACAQLGVMNDCYELKNSEYHYGVLPMPLFDEKQEEYFTYTMRWELFYIPSNADFDRSSIVLEYLNYQTEQEVIPAYWDEALTLRAADSSQDSEMMYIVKDALWYDFITFFNHEVPLRDAVASQIGNGATRLSSWWGSNKKAFEQKLQEVLEKYGSDN